MKSVFFLTAAVLVSAASAADVPKDLSTVRGANYRAAFAKDTQDHWLHYNPADTERDMNYALRLNLNNLRVFISYEAWLADKPAFRRNLTHLLRAAGAPCGKADRHSTIGATCAQENEAPSALE